MLGTAVSFMSAAMFTIDAAVSFHRLREDLAADDEAAGEVVAHHHVETLGAHGGGGRGELAAGIVEQAVDAPGRGHDLGDRVPLTCASSRMSKAWLSHEPPDASISSFTVASLSGLSAVITTCAPKAAISCAAAAADAAAAAGDDDGSGLQTAPA